MREISAEFIGGGCPSKGNIADADEHVPGSRNASGLRIAENGFAAAACFANSS
jgi:hypothetical protein